MNPETVVVASAGVELTEVDTECSPTQIESPAAHGVWTRDVEALCRALDTQQRAHFRSIDATEK
jgi:hypothetical protein